MRQLKIDPELRDYLPGVPGITDAELERQLIESGGALDPVRVWRGRDIIVDGHRRYRLCEKHKLNYRIDELHFADKDAVKHWMDRYQLCRRNLTPREHALVLARMMERYQRDGMKGAAARVADEAGVDRRTVYRAKHYAAALASLPEDIRERITSSDVKASAGDVATLANFDEIHQRAILATYDSGDYQSLAAVLHGEGNEPEEDEAEPDLQPDDEIEPEDGDLAEDGDGGDAGAAEPEFGDDPPFEVQAAAEPGEPEAVPGPEPSPRPPARRPAGRTGQADKTPPRLTAVDYANASQRELGMLKRVIDNLQEAYPAKGYFDLIASHLKEVGRLLECWKTEAD